MILEGAEPFFLQGGPHGVLLIHGFTGLPAELRFMGDFLQKRGFSVLAVRLAGHGTTVEDMSHMTHEDWLDSVRDGYALLSGICEDISVIGHSMGGVFALRLAAEQEVCKVVTLAAPIFIAEERGIKYLPVRENCEGLYVPKARRRLKGVPPVVNRTYRKMPLVSVHELMDAIEAMKPHLEQVTTPLLIVQSHGDHTAAPDSANYIYEHVQSKVKRIYWLETAGHLLPLEPEREQIFAEAAAFLEQDAE